MIQMKNIALQCKIISLSLQFLGGQIHNEGLHLSFAQLWNADIHLWQSSQSESIGRAKPPDCRNRLWTAASLNQRQYGHDSWLWKLLSKTSKICWEYPPKSWFSTFCIYNIYIYNIPISLLWFFFSKLQNIKNSVQIMELRKV